MSIKPKDSKSSNCTYNYFAGIFRYPQPVYAYAGKDDMERATARSKHERVQVFTSSDLFNGAVYKLYVELTGSRIESLITQ